MMIGKMTKMKIRLLERKNTGEKIDLIRKNRSTGRETNLNKRKILPNTKNVRSNGRMYHLLGGT